MAYIITGDQQIPRTYLERNIFMVMRSFFLLLLCFALGKNYDLAKYINLIKANEPCHLICTGCNTAATNNHTVARATDFPPNLLEGGPNYDRVKHFMSEHGGDGVTLHWKNPKGFDCMIE